MDYNKRLDGRGFDELRSMEAKAGVIKKADGSGYFRMGNTTAYAAVYGPKELYPKFMQDPKRGILRFNYSMMPFSGAGDRVRPGPSRRSKEISFVSEKALTPTVDLIDFPNTVVDIFIELPQTDAGSRCCGINAAAIALADAGIAMKDMVAAVAVGYAGNRVVVDLTYKEEHLPEFLKGLSNEHVADIPVAIIPSTGEITLLQMDGIITKEVLMEGLNKALVAVHEVSEMQKLALKEKYHSLENGVNHDDTYADNNDLEKGAVRSDDLQE